MDAIGETVTSIVSAFLEINTISIGGTIGMEVLTIGGGGLYYVLWCIMFHKKKASQNDMEKLYFFSLSISFYPPLTFFCFFLFFYFLFLPISSISSLNFPFSSLVLNGLKIILGYRGVQGNELYTPLIICNKYLITQIYLLIYISRSKTNE